jgi:hypothetical protein
MFEGKMTTHCSQAFATLVGVAVGPADDLTGVEDGFTDVADELVGGLDEEGLAEDADDEGLTPPLLGPRARILAAACSASTTM